MELANQLVGRSAELQRLDDALDRLAATGEAAAVQVVGPGGIGKTRLLSVFAQRADSRGLTVLRGSGADLERDLAFWVFVDALDEYVERVEPQRLHRLGDEVRRRLGQVFPSLSSDTDRANVSDEGERHRTHRAVRALLEQLAAPGPIVLILDDVHWADEASVDLLVSLLHRPPGAPVLLVLGMRAADASPRLTSALERALREHTLQRVELRGLSVAEVAAMLGRPGPDPHTAALQEDSGGNPFYVEQLARAGGTRAGAWGGLPSDDLPVPPMVRAAMAEELALLPARERKLLDGAAVAGDPFDPDLAAAAADLPELEALDAIDALIAQDLLRLTDVPRRFRFRHPILRRAIYDATPGGWRIGAHQRTADALRQASASTEVLAHHVDLSAKPGDASAVAILQDAGRRSAQRAPATAARWFTAALRLLPTSAPGEQRLDLLRASATCLETTGRFAEAHALLVESLEIAPDEQSSLRLSLTGSCARVEHLLGRHDQAHRRLAAALDALPDARGGEAIGLMIELAGDALFRLDYAAAEDWARRAVDAARVADDDALTPGALAILVRALAWGSQAQLAQAVRAEAAALIDPLPDEAFALQLGAAVDLCGAEIYLDEFDAAAARAQRVLEIGRTTRQTQRFPGVYATLGVALCMLGRLDDAAQLLEAAIEAARTSGNPQALAWALFCRAFVALPAGQPELAITAGRESLELASDGGQRVIAARAGAVLAVAFLDAGQPTEAEAVIGPVDQHVELLPPAWRAYVQELMARCWLALGRATDAERAALGARDSAAAAGLRLPTAMAERAAALVALAAGDATTGRARALESVALADAVGAPVEAGLSRTVAGRAFAVLGERDQAVELLREAAAAFDRCGAVAHRSATEQALRRLGEHIHRRSRPGDAVEGGVGSLTARELEIARLIVDRRTNAEIAGELFLSKKTVESHIRNMFRKLDAGSRVDIARAVERHDAGS